MTVEFSNTELSSLAIQVQRSTHPLMKRLAKFLDEASELGGISLIEVRLEAKVHRQ